MEENSVKSRTIKNAAARLHNGFGRFSSQQLDVINFALWLDNQSELALEEARSPHVASAHTTSWRLYDRISCSFVADKVLEPDRQRNGISAVGSSKCTVASKGSHEGPLGMLPT
jgi:hypothetical protein